MSRSSVTLFSSFWRRLISALVTSVCRFASLASGVPNFFTQLLSDSIWIPYRSAVSLMLYPFSVTCLTAFISKLICISWWHVYPSVNSLQWLSVIYPINWIVLCLVYRGHSNQNRQTTSTICWTSSRRASASSQNRTSLFSSRRSSTSRAGSSNRQPQYFHFSMEFVTFCSIFDRNYKWRLTLILRFDMSTVAHLMPWAMLPLFDLWSSIFLKIT